LSTAVYAQFKPTHIYCSFGLYFAAIKHAHLTRNLKGVKLIDPENYHTQQYMLTWKHRNTDTGVGFCV